MSQSTALEFYRVVTTMAIVTTTRKEKFFIVSKPSHFFYVSVNFEASDAFSNHHYFSPIFRRFFSVIEFQEYNSKIIHYSFLLNNEFSRLMTQQKSVENYLPKTLSFLLRNLAKVRDFALQLGLCCLCSRRT